MQVPSESAPDDSAVRPVMRSARVQSVRRISAVLVVLVTAACSSSRTSGAAPGRTASASAAKPTKAPLMAPVDIDKAGAAARHVPGGMDWITLAGGSAWTSNEAITRLDTRDGRVLSTTPLPGPTCLAPDVGYGALWFGVCGAPEVLRVDPTSGKVLRTIKVAGVSDFQPESSVAAGAGGVWLLAKPDRLVQIDPRTNRVARIVQAPAGAGALRASDDALWVTVPVQKKLLKLDPRTLRTLAVAPVGWGALFLALGHGSAWTLDQNDGTVTRVDLATCRQVATIRVSSLPVTGGDIAVGGGFVWARVTDELLAKIDPGSNTLVARYGPTAGSGSVAADATAAWVTAHDSDTVFRLPLS